MRWQAMNHAFRPLTLPRKHLTRKLFLRADGKLRIAFTPDLNGMAQVDNEVETHLRTVLGVLEKSGANNRGNLP